MGGVLGGGGKTKIKYPKKKDVLDLRYPEAIDLENDLRDYFKGVISSPNMGYTSRPTYNPMDMYTASIEDRPRFMAGLTGKPWAGQTSTPTGSQSGGSFGQSSPFWQGSAFERLRQQTPNMMPDWAIRNGPLPGQPGHVEAPPTPTAPTDPTDKFQMALDNMGSYLANQAAGGSKKQRRAMKRLRKLDTEPYRDIPANTDDSLEGVRGSVNDIGDYLATLPEGGSKKQKGAWERLRRIISA